MGRAKKGNGIFTALGAATGLGNALRFPSLCYSYGGAFAAAYIISLVFICFPLLCAELSIGKRYAVSFNKALKTFSPKLGWIACSAAINSAIIALYYGVISSKLGGAFLGFAVMGNAHDISGLALILAGYISLFAVWLILHGKGKRIAFTGALSVAGSLIFLALLAIAVLVRGGSIAKVFAFRLTDLLSGGLWSDALGQSLLALSLAGGVMPTFARSFDADFCVTKCAAKIIAANLAGCLLAAVATLSLPITVPEGSGVTVALTIYPQVLHSAFASGAIRRVFGTLVFASLWLVALQSTCSLLSPVINLAGEEKRNAAVTVACLISLILLPVFAANDCVAMRAVDRMVCSVSAVLIAFLQCLAFSSRRNIIQLKRDCGALGSILLKRLCPVSCGALALSSLCGARFTIFPPYAIVCAFAALALALAPAAAFAVCNRAKIIQKLKLQKS